MLLPYHADPNGEGTGGFGDAPNDDLVIDFQRLFVFENGTNITWFANETCSRDYQVRGYILSSTGPEESNDHIFNVSNATSYFLPSNQYTNSEGVDINYRLLEFTDVCSDNNQIYYYRFIGTQGVKPVM